MLINQILSQMNENRLSTLGQLIVDRVELDLKINKLLNKPSNYEMREGRIWIKYENRFKSEGGISKTLELRDDHDNILNTFKSIAECARFLNISPTWVSALVKKADYFTFPKKGRKKIAKSIWNL